MNWISPTGLSPCTAMPTHRPLMSSSASGVSITRSGPKRFSRPTVARNTPPLTPTSSPSTTTLGSSCMARASARLTASTSVTSAMGAALQLAPLGRVDVRQPGVEVIEHGLRRARPHGEIALHRGLDALLAFGRQLLLLGLAPGLAADEVDSEPRDRLLLPVRLHLLRRAVAGRVVGRGVITQPVRERLDQVWSLAVAGRGNRFLDTIANRDHVVAVHLLAAEAPGNGLLRQRLAGGLLLHRHRDGPLVVVDHEDERQLLRAGEIHGFVHVALGGGAVAEQAHGDARLLAEFEGIGNARRVRGLRAHGNTEGKVVRGAR